MIPWLTPGVSPCGAPSGRLSTAKIVLRPRVCGYWQLDNRIASIKVRTGSGRLTLCTVYAPHNERPTDEKFDFYHRLQRHMGALPGYGPRLVFGGWNARLGNRRTGEEGIMGEHSFGREVVRKTEIPNRDLFVEFCMDFDFLVANTVFDLPPEFKATYHEPFVRPGSPIAANGYNALDLLLVPADLERDLMDIRSDTNTTLASHHFPVVANFMAGDTTEQQAQRRKRKDWSKLRSPSTRRSLPLEVSCVAGSMLRDGSASQRWQSISNSVMAAVDAILPDVQRKPNKLWIS